MSAYKRIHKSDVVVLPYVANKTWAINYGNFDAYNIKIYYGTRYTGSLNVNEETKKEGQYPRLVYNTINHLFYQQYSGSYLNTGSREASNYYTSMSIYRPSASYYDYADSLYISRQYPTGSDEEIRVISIPHELIGTRIVPGTFLYRATYDLVDDEEGNIYALTPNSGSFGSGFSSGFEKANSPTVKIGNIFYNEGIAVITNQSFLSLFSASYEMQFQNEHLVYENIIKCTILDREFKYSYNPTLQVSGSQGLLKPLATASYFSPYITSVGLYNDANELLAVAKLSQPLPTTSETDYNIIVRLDW